MVWRKGTILEVKRSCIIFYKAVFVSENGEVTFARGLSSTHALNRLGSKLSK